MSPLGAIEEVKLSLFFANAARSFNETIIGPFSLCSRAATFKIPNFLKGLLDTEIIVVSVANAILGLGKIQFKNVAVDVCRDREFPELFVF